MNKPVATLGATTLATAIVAGHLWQQLRAERDQSAALRQQVLALQLAGSAQPAPPAGNPAVRESSSVVSHDSAPPAASPAAPAQPDNPRGRLARTVAGEIGSMLQEPQTRAMLMQQVRTQLLPRMYPDVGKELNLTAEEVDQLFEVLARQQVDGGANLLARDAGREAQSDPASRQQREQAALERERANEAELIAVLGGRYSQWQEYQGTLAARQQVTRVGTALAAAGQPLTDAQSRALVAAIAQESRRTQQQQSTQRLAGAANTNELLQAGLSANLQNNRRMREIAASHLTTQQLEAFNAMQEREQRNARLATRLLGGAQSAQPGATSQGP